MRWFDLMCETPYALQLFCFRSNTIRITVDTAARREFPFFSLQTDGVTVVLLLFSRLNVLLYALMIMTIKMNYFINCCRWLLLTKANQASHSLLEFRMNECDVLQSNFVVQLIVVIKILFALISLSSKMSCVCLFLAQKRAKYRHHTQSISVWVNLSFTFQSFISARCVRLRFSTDN